ncbi:hypothetical protein BZZ01_32880 (plasmid) [Nostocales cyanobacterium HT-58-2]|nr:hypothetical protein BZZ01_32880 [Nostocales cyanobacterium HT-58-2]
MVSQRITKLSSLIICVLLLTWLTPLAAQNTPVRSDLVNRLARGEIPEASSRMELPPSAVIPLGNLSLAQVTKKFSQALTSAGYSQQGWYLVGEKGEPLTVAVLTQLEQIRDNGRPRMDGKRWSLDYSSPEINSLGSFIETLLKGAPPGRYRTFFFVFRQNQNPITQQPLQLQPLTQDIIRDWLLRGSRSPQLNVLSKVSSKDYQCFAFIYEYERSSTDGSVTFVKNSTIDASQHLKGSGLWKVLKIQG